MKRFILGVAVFAMICLNVSMAKAADSKIADGKTVKIHYKLTVQGEIADTSEGKDPLEYTHGSKMIIPGLEEALAGLKAGDKKSVVVTPENGYGPIDPNAFLEFPKASLAPGLTPEVGMILQVPTKDGQTFSGMIVEIKEETLLLNFNHPLAGQELNFDIEIVSVD